MQALQANASNGVTAPIPTNVFLWFQVLPGAVPAGGPGTGGGSTAGLQHTTLLVGGTAAVLVGLALFAVQVTRRRYDHFGMTTTYMVGAGRPAGTHPARTAGR